MNDLSLDTLLLNHKKDGWLWNEFVELERNCQYSSSSGFINTQYVGDWLQTYTVFETL